MKLSTTSLVQFATKLGITVSGFVSTLVFARFLGSEVLGTYFLVIAVLSWLEFGSEFGLTAAIQKRVSELEDPSEFLSAGAILIAAFAGFAFIAVVLTHDFISDYVGAEVGLLVGVMLVAKIIYVFADSGLRGYHRVATAAKFELQATVLRVILQVGVVVAGFGLTALLVGYVVAFAITGLLGIYVLISEVEFVRPARRHIESTLQYAQYSWLTILKTRISASMDTIVLGFFVTNALVGIYGASWNLATVLALASQSLSSALFPALSELGTNEDLDEFRSILGQALIYAGIICIPGIVGLAIIGEDILRIYGPSFPDGVGIVVILSVFALFSSYEGQFRTALDALDRPDLTFQINALFVVTNISGNIVLVSIYGWVGAALATAGSMGLSLIYAYILTDRLVGLKIPVDEILRQIAAAVMMGVVVYGLEIVTAPFPYYVVIIPIGVGAGVYFAILFAISKTIRWKAVELLSDWQKTL